MGTRNTRKTIFLISIACSIGFTGVLATWWYFNAFPVTWQYELLEGYMAEHGFENPNLRVGLPVAVDNQIAFYDGYFVADPGKNASSWYLLQWQALDPVDPDPANGTGPALEDPLLGESILVARSSDLQLAIFNQETTAGHAFELQLYGGTLTSGGGRNMFLSTNPVVPVPLEKEVFLNISVHVEEMRVNGTAPVNVVQVFVGMVLKCWNNGSAGDGDTLFMQGIIANTHGNRFYAAGNPVIQCGLYANLIAGELLPPRSGQFVPLSMHVNRFLEDALPRTYHWTEDDGSPRQKTYVDREASHWFLTEIYMGLETQGDAIGIVQLANFSLLEGVRLDAW